MATAAVGASAACEVMAEAREAAVRLFALLQATGADPGRQELAGQIICCIDRALTAARGAGGDGKGRSPEQGLAVAARPPAGSRRRPRGGEARATIVRPTIDDGFVWRKYGEKSIHQQSSPRLYFRCAYKDDHRCGARKQVERLDDDPSQFRTTYFGDHTPACPRHTAHEVDGGHHFLLQPSSFCSFGPCLQAEEAGNEQPTRSAEMVEFVAEDCWDWPVMDQLEDLASLGVSLSSSPGGLESLGANLEELLNCSVDEF